jgi:hypothetical protein
MNNPEFLIAIAVIVGVVAVLVVAVWKLAGLAVNNDAARETFVKLMNPASVVALLILVGVLFLIGMAILDLDKGRVLIGMGKASFARGLIAWLFAVVTIGTAILLVLSALLGTKQETFDNGKEVLSLLLGVFGTIVGFYFASELGRDVEANLAVSSIMTNVQEVRPGGSVIATAFVRGGTAPYRFAVVADKDPLPAEYPELVRLDGWIVTQVSIPSSTSMGVRTLTVGVQDVAGEKVAAQTFVAVTPEPKSR